MISGLPQVCKLLTTDKYSDKLLSWQSTCCRITKMVETAIPTVERACLANQYTGESIAMTDLITGVMGLKIRIPKEIWNAYQPDTATKSHPCPNRTRLKLKIPAHIWNAYHPPTPLHTTNNAPRKLTLKLRCLAPALSSPPQTNNRGVVKNKPTSTDCRVKLFRFHYGGPKRQRKGGWQNKVTYEQPCLEVTCKSCWRWHGHLMREEKLMLG